MVWIECETQSLQLFLELFSRGSALVAHKTDLAFGVQSKNEIIFSKV